MKPRQQLSDGKLLTTNDTLNVAGRMANNIAIELQMKTFSNCDAKKWCQLRRRSKRLNFTFDESRFVTCKRETNFEGRRRTWTAFLSLSLAKLFFVECFPFILIADFTRWLSHVKSFRVLRASRLMLRVAKHQKWKMRLCTCGAISLHTSFAFTMMIYGDEESVHDAKMQNAQLPVIN